METKLCKHGHLVCPHCAIKEQNLVNYGNSKYRIQGIPTKFTTFGVNRKYY